MALTSPGVEVSVINESFYVPSDAGTTPLFIVASSQDKTNGAGDGTAVGTTTANANTATSQGRLPPRWQSSKRSFRPYKPEYRSFNIAGSTGITPR